jgi:hypothetical protein
MWLQMNNSLLFILAAAFGISAALVLFATPRIFVGMFESKGNFDAALLFLGSASALLGVCQFLFMRSRPRNAWLSFSVLGAILIYAEIFDAQPIKFMACKVLLHRKHHGPVYYSNELPLRSKSDAKVSSIES